MPGREGRISAVSEQEAVLETAENLAVYDNLLLTVGEGLYAKVTETWKGGCRICFTSQPRGFQSWLEQIRQASAAGTEEETHS